MSGSLRRVLACALGVALLVPVLGADWLERRDVARMTEAAEDFLSSLTEAQRDRATLEFDSSDRTRFHFIPLEMFERQGLMLADMSPRQVERAHGLLQAGLSPKGYLTAVQVMELEDVLLAMEGGQRFARDRDEYLVSVFGAPGSEATWGWRFEGHHISIHFTVIEGELAVASPAFVGANPAEVREGPQRGRRALGDREDAGRAVMVALGERLGRAALIDVEAPRDIVTGNEARVERLSPAGVPAADMTAAQRELLTSLVDVYLGVMSDDISSERRARLVASGTDAITFAWAGSVDRGEAHYYRVQGPTFLIEYDNTQNDANHIHSVWRDFDGDFGRDLIREHRAEHPHE